MNTIKLIFQKPYLYIFIILIGIALKFYKLDQQFFWDDEICTILHTSGIPMAEYKESIPENMILHKSYFDNLLRLNSRNLKISDQIKGLAKMPQLTPAHYYYLIFITRIFGDNYMVYRYFSVFLFLLSIPILFLLTKKIFNSKLSGWIAISFYVVSPFFQIYVQEARYYPLWAFSLILLNYLFILAIEKENKKWWILYFVYGAIAVQTTIMMYVTVFCHFIYTFLYYKPQLKKVFVSQLAIFFTSLPWLFYVYLNHGEIHNSINWLHRTNRWGYSSLFDLIITHFNNTITTFSFSHYLPTNDAIKTISATVIGVIIIYATITFFKKATNKQKWFIGMMSFIGFMVVGTLDIIRSTWSLQMPRYSLMSFIGFFILIGFAFHKSIEKKAILYGPIFLIIIVIGISSSIFIANDTAKPEFKRDDTPFYQNDAKGKYSGSDHILIITDFKLFPITAFISMLHASENKNIDIIYSRSEYRNYKTEFNLDSYDKIYFAYISDDMLNYLKGIFRENEISGTDSYNTYIYNRREDLK